MRRRLTPLEQRFLLEPPPGALARLATVDPTGMPHVVPVGWSFDLDEAVLVLGGRDVARTVRARHVAASGKAAVVIDGVTTGEGWKPWALMVRGRATLTPERDAIWLQCDEVSSWGLEHVPAP